MDVFKPPTEYFTVFTIVQIFAMVDTDNMKVLILEAFDFEMPTHAQGCDSRNME